MGCVHMKSWLMLAYTVIYVFQPNIYIISFLVLFLGISLDVVLLIDLFMTLYKMYLIHPLWF